MSKAQANTAEPASHVSCPRCQQPLIDPEGLGWCRGCGYCRSLVETEKKIVPAATTASQPNRLAVTGEAVGFVPQWFWMMLLGIGLITGATYAGGHFLSLTPFQRALLTTVQIGLSVITMFIGQFIGLMRIAPDEPTVNFMDAVFPFRLYGLIFKRLPRTQVTVLAASWGLTALIASVVFIGGLGHWFTYLPGNQKKNQPNQVQKANPGR